jgi:hypothetical protein
MRSEPPMPVQNICKECQVSMVTVRWGIRGDKPLPDLGHHGVGYSISREEPERYKLNRSTLVSPATLPATDA